MDALFEEVGVKGKFKELQRDLRRVGNQSIDDLLRHREDLRDAGRAAIAYEILSLENEDHLTSHTGDDSVRTNDRWYFTLFSYCRNLVRNYEEFGELPIHFITFNYDRSFDHYWTTAVHTTYKPPGSWMKQYVESHPILHVHGQLGPLPWQVAYVKDSVPLGTPPTASVIERVMYWIRTPYDTHKDKSGVPEKIQKVVKEAAAVFFIGFAFDQGNFDKLGWPADKPPQLLYSHFTKDDEERRRVREDVFKSHTAFVGRPDDMSKAFLDKAWPHYTKWLGKEWGRPLNN
jgi:hypothetical protein